MISKSTVGVFISMVVVSVLLANVVNLISINAESHREFTNEKFFKISDKFQNLIWFIQISDLHISIFRDESRITEFKEFCHYAIDVLKPSVVLASGDLTDAKTQDAIGSQQFEDEWRHYRDILKELNIKNKTLWMDIRGNHDNFNVIDNKSKQNFFTNYSVQGLEHPRSYMKQISKDGLVYSFIGVDACLEPGPRRPFNFVGIIDEPEVNELNYLIKKSQQTGSNYTIWFGHFPTSCILTTGPKSVRNIIKKDKNSMVYVCGHLHTLGGLITKMYAMQKQGFLELELGDWKDNRMYRLMAIDHGMFSFTDVKHREWPVVLITNPKNALFVIAQKENLDNIKLSTHIRILAFSISPLQSVKAKINNGNWIECKHIQGPLYVARWDPKNYLHGIHHIEVMVRDMEGRQKVEVQPFSIDGTRLEFDILPRLALMSNASQLFQIMFVLSIVLYILPLVITRLIHKLVMANKMPRPLLTGSCSRNLLRKILILSTVDRIFWPMVLYPIYLAFGPWSIGYIVEDYIGVIFAWGIFVNGAYLPGSFTYAYGFLQLISFQVPLTFILASHIDRRFKHLTLKSSTKQSIWKKIQMHLPFSIVFGVQVVMAYLFWLAYGTLAFVLGFLRTWSLVLAAILYYMVLNLPEECTRKVAELCNKKSSEAVSSMITEKEN